MSEPEDLGDPDYHPGRGRVPSVKRRAGGLPRHASPHKQSKRTAIKRVSFHEPEVEAKHGKSTVNSLQAPTNEDCHLPMGTSIREQLVFGKCKKGDCTNWRRADCDQRTVPCQSHWCYANQYHQCQWEDGLVLSYWSISDSENSVI